MGSGFKTKLLLVCVVYTWKYFCFLLMNFYMGAGTIFKSGKGQLLMCCLSSRESIRNWVGKIDTTGIMRQSFRERGDGDED